MTPIIQISQLSHCFGKQQVLHDLSLEIPSGSLFGFLGPNGSGKTTTIRLLLGLLKSQNNAIRIFGQDIRSCRESILRRTGALIESPALYLHLSAHDNLEIIRSARQSDKRQLAEVLEIVGLSEQARQKTGEYSLGMRQRLGIAMAMIGNPELLILDEPTNGLDPAGIRQIRELLLALCQHHGKTVFVSSHLLDEIEKTVSHLAILHDGRLLFQGSLAQLHEQQPLQLAIETDNNLRAADILRNANFRIPEITQDRLCVAVAEKRQIDRINRLLLEEGLCVYELNRKQRTLEEAFFSMTADPSRINL